MDPSKLNLVLDTPFYSKRSLKVAPKTRFFDLAGVNANDNIDIGNQLDKNSNMTLNYMQFRLSALDKAVLAVADLNLIAAMQQETWITMNLNTSDKVWQSSLSSILQYPSIMADAASAYNLGNIVNGIVQLNTPIIIEGGTNVNFFMERETVTDYSAIIIEWILWGTIDRRKTVE